MTQSTAVEPARLLRVDGPRLLAGIDDLAAIGATPAGGVTRLGFSPEEDQARDYLRTRAEDSGLTARVDAAGNVVIRRRPPATGPVLMMGSHVDTVVDGGRLDGAYGVLAALEVLTVLAESGEQVTLDPVVVAFANEEGGLFPSPFFGSLAVAGDPGVTSPSTVGPDLRQAVARAGGDPARLDEAAWPRGSIGAFLELHIEQGARLEDAGRPIGVVHAITGRVTFDVLIDGRQGHAGTTPMEGRADALVCASHVILGVEAMARAGVCSVATIGRVQSHPDQPNVIPGKVRLAGELRDLSTERMGAAQRALEELAAAIAQRHGVTARVEVTGRVDPMPTEPAIRAAVRDAADLLGLPSMDIDSRAGHDAQVVARVAPVGMVFVPSHGGLSHTPEEHTDPADLVAGADVLLHAALALAR